MAELVIFDCDGVLVDSETLVIQVESRHLRSVGIDLTPEEVADRYVGLSQPSMAAAIEAEFGVAVGDEFFTRATALIAEEFERALVPIPGMASLLDDLDGPRCVASSSRPARIAHSLGLTDLARHFDPARIFSATMVERGKPAPDLFLHAAGSCSTDPSRCVVVEDSPAGVAAAVAAGMPVIGFSAGGHCRPGHDERLRAAGATDVVDSAAALTRYL